MMVPDRSVRHVGLLLALVILLLGVPRLTLAQTATATATATLTGKVIDETETGVAAASLTLTNDSSSVSRTAESTPEGTFIFPGLPPGRYTLRVQCEGFSPLEMPNVVLNENDKITLRVQLRVAAVGEQVMVTAQKRGAERLQDVPVPVSVLDADSLAGTARVLLRDYYTSVPGLSVAPNIETTQMISIRGISTGSFTTPTVGVMIDEVPYGGSTSNDGGNNVPDIDPGDLARVEVLRGPQGTLYGANSMGGLLKFVLKEPSFDRFSGSVTVGTNGVHNGDQPGFNLRASANIPISSTFALRGSLFSRQDPGYIDNPSLNRKGVNEIDAAGGRLAALWRPSEAFSLKLNGLYQREKADGLSEITVAPGLGDLQQNFVAGVDRYTITNQAYSAIVKAKIGGGVELTSNTGYNLIRSTTPFDFTYAFRQNVQDTYGVGGAAWITYLTLHKFSQEVRLAGHLGRRFDWLAGGFYTDEEQPDSNRQELHATDAHTGVVVGEYWHRSIPMSFKEYAAFGNLTVHFTNRFDVQMGLRESHSRETDNQIMTGQYIRDVLQLPEPDVHTGTSTGHAVTYLLTPQFKISPDLMVYGRLASGYRPGGPNAFAYGVPPKFDSDTSENYEVGMKGSFLGHRLMVDGSLYYIDWESLQLNLFSPQAFGYGANGSAARSDGIELSMEVRPWHGLSITGWISYDDAVLTKDFPAASTAFGRVGDRLPNTPRFSHNVSIEQQFPLGARTLGFAGGTVSHVGQREGLFAGTDAGGSAPLQRQVYPAYTRTDLTVGIRRDTWTASLFANNVGDVRGLTSGGLGYVLETSFTYIQPRTVGFSVSKTF